jgi:hypothetical protein
VKRVITAGRIFTDPETGQRVLWQYYELGVFAWQRRCVAIRRTAARCFGTPPNGLRFSSVFASGLESGTIAER